jgi:hypothetical protein
MAPVPVQQKNPNHPKPHGSGSDSEKIRTAKNCMVQVPVQKKIPDC